MERCFDENRSDLHWINDDLSYLSKTQINYSIHYIGRQTTIRYTYTTSQSTIYFLKLGIRIGSLLNTCSIMCILVMSWFNDFSLTLIMAFSPFLFYTFLVLLLDSFLRCKSTRNLLYIINPYRPSLILLVKGLE